MAHRCKKYLSLLLTIALLNSSIQPLYASFPDREDEVVREAKAHSRMMMVEESLQAKVKTTVSFVESWTPSFIKKTVSRLGTWVESTLKDLPASYFAKSPLEIDYGRDRAYWLADFSSAVDDIKEGGYSNNALHARIVKLQDMVLAGVISPYVYEKGLQEIQASGLGNQALFDSTREDFKKALKTAPGFISQTFKHEASLYIRDLQEGKGDVQDFISHIRYYRDVANALDYKETLTTIRSYLRDHKKILKITQKDNDALITTLNTEIGRTSKDEKKHLKADQAFSSAASSILPYFGEEWDEIKVPTNNSLAESLKGKDIIKEYLTTSSKALRKAFCKNARFVEGNPGQAIMMVLAGQIAVAAAFNSFTGREIAKAPSRQAKTQAMVLAGENKEQNFPPFTYSFLQGAAINIGTEFLLNQNTTNNWDFSIAPLTSGNVFVAWTGNSDIYGRLFSANGTALGPEFLMNQNTAGSQWSPSVAGLTNGNALVAWTGDNIEAWNNDIYGRLFSANGTALGPEFLMHQNTTGNQWSPSVAGLTNGNALVAWIGDHIGGWKVYGGIYSADGTVLNTEFTISQDSIAKHSNPSVAGLTNGNAFVTWMSQQALQRHIYGRLFSANGIALGPEFLMNQNTISNCYPSIAPLINGNAFVAWMVDHARNADIYGRLFSANGTALGSQFLISQDTSANLRPSIAPLINGNAFVAWMIDHAGNADIYGRLFSVNGTALCPQFLISQNFTGYKTKPSVAGFTNGNAFAAWKDDQGRNIYGCMIYLNTTPVIGTTELATGISISNSPLPPYQSISDHSEIIIPATIVGGTLILAVGGIGYYIYKHQKHSSTTSLQAIELGPIASSPQADLSLFQQTNSCATKVENEDSQTANATQLIPYTSILHNLSSASTEGSISSQQLSTETFEKGSENIEATNSTQPIPYVSIFPSKEVSTLKINERMALLPK